MAKRTLKVFSDNWIRRIVRAVRRVESFRMTGACSFTKGGDSMSAHVWGAGGGGGGGLRRMRVKAIQNDYLTCVPWDGTTEGESVNVAKRWDHQRTPFDGNTINSIEYTYTSAVERTADDGSQTETQVIVPEWFVNAEILVDSVDSTGVEVDEVELTLVDVTHRAWARQRA